MSFNKAGRENLLILIPLIVAICLVIGFFLGARFGTSLFTISLEGNNKSNNNQQIVTLNQALGFLSSKYVDPLRKDSLVDVALKQWMSGLDPFSSYIKPQDLAWMNKRLSGSYVGIGVEFTIKNDSILVVSVLENGPAAIAGILAGDYLIDAGEKISPKMERQSAEKLIHKIRGKVGTKVEVKVFRPFNRKYLTINCVRKDLEMPSVEPFIDYNKSVGYIRIKEFSAKTDQEFMLAMDSLFGKQNNEKDLILDLRGNPGGYLEKSTHLLNQLIAESGKIMVTTKTKEGKETVYKTSGRPFFKPRKIVVFMDENSASASEIVAGALQDHKRAVIIGRPSFGKGLVQSQFNLSNGGALKLTIAKFYTPSGKLIQKPYKIGDTSTLKGGIMPDIFIPLHFRDTMAEWKYAERQILPFTTQNKLSWDMKLDKKRENYSEISSLFSTSHPLVNTFLSQHKLGEDFRTLVWQNLKVAYVKKSFGMDAAMRVEFEMDPFLSAALNYLKKETQEK
jgi:carboxyl-terminal processing protease